MSSDPASHYAFLRSEIDALIRRVAQESDIKIFEVIGVLEVVKADLIACVGRSRPSGGSDNPGVTGDDE